MKAFICNNELYIRCIPSKNLFRSTMVHEVVNRGDIFALRVSDQTLTIIPGTSVVEHLELNISRRPKVDTVLVAKMRKEATAAFNKQLAQINLDLEAI